MHQTSSIQEREIVKSNEEISKPNCIAPYSKYMKGVDHAGQYLSYCSVVRKLVNCYEE
jgi:hypothetical protein